MSFSFLRVLVLSLITLAHFFPARTTAELISLHTIDDFKYYIQSASSGDGQSLSILAAMHLTGDVFPPYRSDAIRLAVLAESFGWDYSEEVWDYLKSKVSQKTLSRIYEEINICDQPFSEDCKVSKPLELDTAYTPTANIELWRFQKGLIFDKFKKVEVTGFFNHEMQLQIDLPKIFSGKLTTFTSNSDEPNNCRVEGEDMDLVWFINSSMPPGKALELHKKDFLSFNCIKVDLQ